MWSGLMRHHLSRGLVVCAATTASAIMATRALGQAAAATSGASGTLAAVDFAGSTPGPFPLGGSGVTGPLRAVSGTLEIMDHLGQRMLRASSRATLLLSLPSALPRDFTVEIDLVPKECCQPEDIAIEGSTTINQGTHSANILWHHNSIALVGGGGGFDKPMPPAIAGTLPGALTNIMFTFRGDELTIYTNGQLVYTVPNRLFLRGRVLRLFLGGQNDTDRAVYLAGVRVAAGALSPNVATGSSGSGGSPTANAPPSGGTGSAAQPFSGNVTVTPGASGPLVSWTPVGGNASYQVLRWKADDPACCVSSSSITPAPGGSPWQDSPPPLPGTYVYQVTAFASGGPYVTQGQYVYQGSGGQTITAPSGGNQSPQVGGGASNTANVTPPRPAGAGGVPAGLTVNVAIGASGPVVNWNIVAGATGYSVRRVKSDDPNCCNAFSGATRLSNGPWQDQPLPMTGTYVYTVTANTAAGALQGSAQLAYTAPVTAIPVAPAGGTGMTVPAGTSRPTGSTSSVPPPPGGTSSAGSGTYVPPPPASGAASSGNPANVPAPPSGGTSGGPGGPCAGCSGRFRVTLTGFHASVSTLEPSLSPDGRGDEIYVAAVAIPWNRQARTAGFRTKVKTVEYGDLGTAGMYGSRIRAGSVANEGGIKDGDRVSGPTNAAPTNDRLPLEVWTGPLTDVVDALLVVPTLWERDVDATFHAIWERYWTTASMLPLFIHPQVAQQFTSPSVTHILNPITTLGTPLDIPLADLQGSIRDHPIGITLKPVPPAPPVVGRYEDRLVVITREKLANLSVGGVTTLTIPLQERSSIFSKGDYLLYLLIERLQ